jgi:rod shape-determining protein MreD
MKVVTSLLMLLAVTLLLRSTALTALASRGVVIDALAFATMVWALRYGETWGTSFGFALGLAADLDAAHWLGRHALVLALLGYVIGRASHSLVRDSARTQLVVLFLTTLVHGAWVAAFEFGGLSAAWLPLARRVALAAVTTAPVGMLTLFILRRVSGAPLFGHASLQSSPPA